MIDAASSDTARFYRPRLIPGVELVSVCYRDRSFPEHSHREYVVGVVVEGAETLTIEGRSHRVDAGRILRLHPEEAHANATLGSEILRYHVLYLPDETIRDFVGPEHGCRPLTFQTPVLDEPDLFTTIRGAHTVLGREAAGALEQESAFAMLVRALVAASPGETERRSLPVYSRSVAVAKAYIDDHYARSFSLHDLAELTGISIFHFARSFKKSVGLSPLAYRNQRRIAEARARILDGEPIAQVALNTGYADQSHLTRQFQRIVGVSPRRYSQQ